MKYSYAVFSSTQSTSIRSIRSTSGNTQGHYRDEVFVCKSDVGPGRALLPAFVKEDTQPIAEIPIQKIETKTPIQTYVSFETADIFNHVWTTVLSQHPPI